MGGVPFTVVEEADHESILWMVPPGNSQHQDNDGILLGNPYYTTFTSHWKEGKIPSQTVFLPLMRDVSWQFWFVRTQPAFSTEKMSQKTKKNPKGHIL